MPGSAIIVGVGPGLGAAIARRFAQGGYPVALIARKRDSLIPVQESIEAAKGKAMYYTADSTDEEQVTKAFTQIVDDLGKPEVLCYNVGPNIGAGGSGWPPPLVEDMSLERFRKGLDTGVVGAFIWAKKAIPHMKAEQKGTLLFTGATASLKGSAHFSSLSPAKFALRSLTQTLARELQSSGIHVAHIVVDGVILSERAQQYVPNKPIEEFMKPEAIAEEYWNLHKQDKSTWSQEIDLRPYTEKF